MKMYKWVSILIVVMILSSSCNKNNTNNKKFEKNTDIDISTIDEEELLVIQVNKKMGYIDREGNVIIEPKFKFAGKFSNGLARVRTQDMYKGIGVYGYIDK